MLTAGVLAKTRTPAIAEDTSNIRNNISSDKDDHSMETPVTSLDDWIPPAAWTPVTEGTKTEALAIAGTLTKTGNVVDKRRAA